LLKTFYSGWRDRQLPDGTVIWTDPGGQTHTTRPGSYRLFPKLCQPTAPVDLSAADLATAAAATEQQPGRGLAMPRRRRTRAQDRAARIEAERRLNEAQPQPRHVTTPPDLVQTGNFASWLAALPPGNDMPAPY
jgi:hypothetical protein